MTINFSHNWNGKLFLDFFGTVRLHCAEKYYVGNEMELEFKNHSMGTVRVAAVRKFRFENINDVLSHLDVGKPAAYLSNLMRRFYEKQVTITPDLEFDHIIFQYIKRNIPVQTELIKHWWDEKTAQEDPVTPQSNENLLFT